MQCTSRWQLPVFWCSGKITVRNRIRFDGQNAESTQLNKSVVRGEIAITPRAHSGRIRILSCIFRRVICAQPSFWLRSQNYIVVRWTTTIRFEPVSLPPPDRLLHAGRPHRDRNGTFRRAAATGRTDVQFSARKTVRHFRFRSPTPPPTVRPTPFVSRARNVSRRCRRPRVRRRARTICDGRKCRKNRVLSRPQTY